jgi:hypothetical protein
LSVTVIEYTEPPEVRNVCNASGGSEEAKAYPTRSEGPPHDHGDRQHILRTTVPCVLPEATTSVFTV